MSFKSILKLSGCILLTLVVGGVSGFLTKDDITTWYAGLAKPVFNPPNFVFGPVWTLLYILMGVSLYLILQSPKSGERNRAVVVFCAQLFLNFWWSIIFFRFHRVGLAQFEMALLWLSILWMIILFVRQRPVAGYLQIPYLLWVSFASVLNFGIWVLN